MRKFVWLFPFIFSVSSFAAQAKDIERHYCTQFGPFYLRFDDEKAAGIFNIFMNNDMGSVVGKLVGNKIIGNWIEVDSSGRIQLEFSDDWSSFDASYSVGEASEDWRTGWHGVLRPAGRPKTFVVDTVTYHCERA